MSEFVCFTSTHGALTWYFGFDRAQIPRNLLAIMSGESLPTGGGLSGFNGAHMAGRIGAAFGALPDYHQILLIAKFAPARMPCACKRPCCCGSKPNPQWSCAIDAITSRTVSVLAGTVTHHRLRRGLIEKIFGRDVTLADLADYCGVNRDTASSHHAKLVAHINGERGGKRREGRVGELQRAHDTIDADLRARHVVSSHEDTPA